MPDRPTVLLLETIHADALAALQQQTRVLHEESPEAIVGLVQTEPIEAIITRGKGQVHRALIEQAKNLKVIARVGVGLDNIDVDAASEYGIRVINAPGSTTEAVAEHTLLLMLALVRQVYPLTHAVKQNDWAYRRSYLGDSLADKTLGLVGMGAIAQRVAEMAQVFGMTICYWNRTPKALPYRSCLLHDLLTESDIVSVHVALMPETQHLLDRTALATMKPGSYLINTARGGVIDQRAVYDFLASGHLAGFAADVLDPEPPDLNDPLLAHPRAFITPHTAALTEATFRNMGLRTINNVCTALLGGSPEPGSIFNADALQS